MKWHHRERLFLNQYKRLVIDGLIHLAREYPAVLSIITILISILIFGSLYFLSFKISELTTQKNAALFVNIIAEVRRLYTSEVIANISGVKGVNITHNYKEEKNAIPLPATFSIIIGDSLRYQESETKVRLFSDHPFPFRDDGGPRDSFEREALLFLREAPKKSFSRVEKINDIWTLRYAKADIMHKECLSCHNGVGEYGEKFNSPKRDWNVGDVRGVLEVSLPVYKTTKEVWSALGASFLIIFLIIGSGLVFLGLVIGGLKHSVADEKNLAKKLGLINTELEQENQERTRAEKRFRALSSCSPVGVFEMSTEGYCTYVNPRWETITMRSLKESTGDGWMGIIPPEKRIFFSKNWQQIAKEKNGFLSEFIFYPSNEIKCTRWLRSRITAIRDENYHLTGYVGILEDITDSKNAEETIISSLHEKEALLQEVHHRVKNNLQIISSLLRLQIASITDKVSLGILQETHRRIQSMAIIHEKLYYSQNLANIRFYEYVRELVTYLFRIYAINVQQIKTIITMDRNLSMYVDKAIPCGLIINELVTNALKYAFPNKSDKGEIRIEFFKKDTSYTLKVYDTGIGIPETVDFENTDTLGLQLVMTLAKQLNAEIQLDNSQGTSVTLLFSASDQHQG